MDSPAGGTGGAVGDIYGAVLGSGVMALVLRKKHSPGKNGLWS